MMKHECLRQAPGTVSRCLPWPPLCKLLPNAPCVAPSQTRHWHQASLCRQTRNAIETTATVSGDPGFNEFSFLFSLI